jgi:ATP-dependent DNA ligase
VSIPLSPPLLPQLARSRSSLPTGDGWAYEPKWDGFRAIAFVDGDDLYVQSRSGKPLLRYFPELTFPRGRYVLDGEIVIFGEGGTQEFDRLGQRIHPAASRIARLAEETPSRFIAFDLLARDDESLLELPYGERRTALEDFIAELAADGDVVPELTPSTRDAAEAEPWLHGAEGVVAKEIGAPYRPGERVGMVKIKRVRTIDAVVMGWRPGKEEGTVGSLILGLYDDGELRVVGHSSGFKAAEKRSLVETLAPYATGERGSGDPSRWRPDHELEWIALRPELVVEITFDHVSSGRIRHGTKVKRWRDDKDPRDCLVDQLDS